MSAANVIYNRPAVLNAQLAHQITSKLNTTHNIIPGGSPFFYMEDPANSLFAISSISITPTPCQIGFPCVLEAKGIFRTSLSSIDLNFDVEARLKDGRAAKIIAVNDDLCDWASVKQDGHESCPPKRGAATLSAELELARGWVMEATYFIDLKLTSGNRLLTHIGAKVVLEDLNSKSQSISTATS